MQKSYPLVAPTAIEKLLQPRNHVSVDVVQGTTGNGRVTKWAYVCSSCPGILGKHGNRKQAQEQARTHSAEHRAGKIQ